MKCKGSKKHYSAQAGSTPLLASQCTCISLLCFWTLFSLSRLDGAYTYTPRAMRREEGTLPRSPPHGRPFPSLSPPSIRPALCPLPPCVCAYVRGSFMMATPVRWGAGGGGEGEGGAPQGLDSAAGGGTHAAVGCCWQHGHRHEEGLSLILYGTSSTHHGGPSPASQSTHAPARSQSGGGPSSVGYTTTSLGTTYTAVVESEKEKARPLPPSPCGIGHLSALGPSVHPLRPPTASSKVMLHLSCLPARRAPDRTTNHTHPPTIACL